MQRGSRNKKLKNWSSKGVRSKFSSSRSVLCLVAGWHHPNSLSTFKLIVGAILGSFCASFLWRLLVIEVDKLTVECWLLVMTIVRLASSNTKLAFETSFACMFNFVMDGWTCSFETGLYVRRIGCWMTLELAVMAIYILLDDYIWKIISDFYFIMKLFIDFYIIMQFLLARKKLWVECAVGQLGLTWFAKRKPKKLLLGLGWFAKEARIIWEKVGWFE